MFVRATKIMREELAETEYATYKKLVHKVFREIDNLDQRINDVIIDFKDSQRANAFGLQNVYSKFHEIEVRQKDIEELLEMAVDKYTLSDLKENLAIIQEDLQELTNRFTF